MHNQILVSYIQNNYESFFKLFGKFERNVIEDAIQDATLYFLKKETYTIQSNKIKPYVEISIRNRINLALKKSKRFVLYSPLKEDNENGTNPMDLLQEEVSDPNEFDYTEHLADLTKYLDLLPEKQQVSVKHFLKNGRTANPDVNANTRRANFRQALGALKDSFNGKIRNKRKNLSSDEIAEIQRNAAVDTFGRFVGVQDLAAQYGVSSSAVSKILKGATEVKLTEPRIKNPKRDVCLKGHLLTPENLKYEANGDRRCRICLREKKSRDKKRAAKRKAADRLEKLKLEMIELEKKIASEI